jgi:hypothetical protein
VFGVVQTKVNTIGYLTESDMDCMKSDGMMVCNHSARHLLCSCNKGKDWLEPHSVAAVFDDGVKAKNWLNSLGHRGDVFIVPFGTQNIDGGFWLNKYMEEFSFIRLTVGATKQGGGWIACGGKRLYRSDIKYKVVGVSAAADVRFPNNIQEVIYNAIQTKALAVISYYGINHVVGEGQNITLKQFKNDITFIRDVVERKEIEICLPE